ncbi:formate dehydrogenase accessory sulfurtransferase FdhD [Sphingomonas fennica]|uniref:formate dehydrogenase accessory sulfurtransferase FdhD n=1 Tax=Edaphosphingomonas fennica TaxID=114404 RepID=UPI003CCBB58D
MGRFTNGFMIAKNAPKRFHQVDITHDSLSGRRALLSYTGFMLLTARCSYELVEKTIRAGCPMLVTVSARPASR